MEETIILVDHNGFIKFMSGVKDTDKEVKLELITHYGKELIITFKDDGTISQGKRVLRED